MTAAGIAAALEAAGLLQSPESAASPWERAVAGLNALVDADVIFHVEPDGHISAPFSDRAHRVGPEGPPLGPHPGRRLRRPPEPPRAVPCPGVPGLHLPGGGPARLAAAPLVRAGPRPPRGDARAARRDGRPVERRSLRGYPGHRVPGPPPGGRPEVHPARHPHPQRGVRPLAATRRSSGSTGTAPASSSRTSTRARVAPRERLADRRWFDARVRPVRHRPRGRCRRPPPPDPPR